MTGPGYRIETVNPLDYKAELKALFLADGREEYPEFFDRAYPAAVAAGGRSWVGFDAAGRVVMHMAVFPHRFAVGDGTIMGALGVNLMVAKEFRQFFPALSLLKRVVQDTARAGDIDFLYADPNEQGRAILRAAGFAPVGTLERFVLPIGDRNPFLAVAARAHLVLRLGMNRAGFEFRMTRHAAREWDVGGLAQPPGWSPRLRPFHPPEVYPRRLGGYPAPQDTWFMFHGGGHEMLAAALVRELPLPAVAQICALWRHPHVGLAPLMRHLVPELRHAGMRRLQVWTVAESSLARELREVGLVPRGDQSLVIARPLSERGSALLEDRPDWEITDLDCDRGA